MKNITKRLNGSKTWQVLAYLGLLPFIFFIWISYFPTLTSELNPQQAFVYYSAMILSFLSGALWSENAKFCHTAKESVIQSNTYSILQIMSNLYCLYAFGCLLMQTSSSLPFLLFGYLALLLTEYLLCYAHDKIYTEAYFKMRVILTVCVVTLHCYAFYSWYFI